MVNRIFPEDSDMLYIEFSGGSAGIFVRNSGTEDKISINLRGSKSDASNLRQMGLEAIKILFTTLFLLTVVLSSVYYLSHRSKPVSPKRH